MTEYKILLLNTFSVLKINKKDLVETHYAKKKC